MLLFISSYAFACFLFWKPRAQLTPPPLCAYKEQGSSVNINNKVDQYLHFFLIRNFNPGFSSYWKNTPLFKPTFLFKISGVFLFYHSKWKEMVQGRNAVTSSSLTAWWRQISQYVTEWNTAARSPAYKINKRMNIYISKPNLKKKILWIIEVSWNWVKEKVI